MNERDIIRIIRSVWRSTDDGALTSAEKSAAIEAVRELSLRLTRDRRIVTEQYLDDPQLLAGYVAFFLPRSVHQIASILGELDRSPRRVLDLGCGPGAATAAALGAGAEKVVAVDHAPRAVELVERLHGDRVVTSVANLETVKISSCIEEHQIDTVVVSHAINELFTSGNTVEKRTDWIADGAKALGPDGRFIIIDPALRETSRDLLEVRDSLVARGVEVLAPCLHQQACQALDKATDWCHAERPWNPPQLVREIADAVGVRDDVAKMTYLVLGAGAPEHPPNRYRVVSEPLHTKGRLRYFGCGTSGRISIIMKERDAKRSGSEFAELERGDVIEIGETIEKGDGFVIQKGEPAVRIARAGDTWPEGL